jgi:HEAT repeat protein
MWRRYGDAVYGLVVAAVFVVETIALGVLSSGFVLRMAGIVPAGRLQSLLVTALVWTAVVLLLLAVYVLAYHYVSAQHERRRAGQLEKWTEGWIGALFGEGPPEGLDERPGGPAVPKAGVEGALDVLEVIAAEEGEQLRKLLDDYGISEALIRKLGSRRLSTRLDALEALSKARLAAAFSTLVSLLGHRKPVVRRMAVRAGARTLAAMRPEPGPDPAVEGFVEALETVALPYGVVEEGLLLLEIRAPEVISRILDRPDPPATLLRATLETVGRLRLVDMADTIAVHARHDDPEIRAAVFRALSHLALLPRGAGAAVLAAITDDVEFVRVQATHAAAFLSPKRGLPALRARLSDSSWWVRRAAAQSLLRLENGSSVLLRVARTHSDRFARDMAVQVLLEAGVLDAESARRLKEAA